MITETALTDSERAIAMLEQARNEPTYGDALRGVGRALIEREEFERALELYEDIRESDYDHHFAYLVSLGKASIKNDDLEHALEFASYVPQDRQILYFQFLSYTWAITNPELLLEEIENLPSAEIQSAVATILKQLEESRHTLSEDQLESLEKFLPDQQE